MSAKRELATRIAVATFPQSFWIDSPAIQGEIDRLMKSTVKELSANMFNLEAVEAQRELESMENAGFSISEEAVEVEVGTCRCPDCKEGAVAIEDDDICEMHFVSNCCYARVDVDEVYFDLDYVVSV